MQLENYRALISAIDTGSISAAAEALSYTPSGVSRMIAALEREFGFALLRRGKGGVTPTAECRSMLPLLRKLCFTAEGAEQLASQIRGLETGTVTIGTAYSAYYGALAQISSAFHALHPGIQVRLCGGYSSELLDRLQKHQADLCIISRREGEYRWTELCRDPLMAWVPDSHPLAVLPALPLECFETEPCIETFSMAYSDNDNTRAFDRCGIKPNICFTTTDIHASYSMVEAGLGICMNNALNGCSLSGRVKIMPLEPPQYVSIGIASLPEPSPAAKAFLDFISARLEQLRIPGAGE